MNNLCFWAPLIMWNFLYCFNWLTAQTDLNSCCFCFSATVSPGVDSNGKKSCCSLKMCSQLCYFWIWASRARATSFLLMTKLCILNFMGMWQHLMKISEHTLEVPVGTAPFSVPPPAFSLFLVCWPAKQYLHVTSCNPYCLYYGELQRCFRIYINDLSKKWIRFYLNTKQK